ncbi:MAG: hypothetical protein ABH837_01870 [bacterium]
MKLISLLLGMVILASLAIYSFKTYYSSPEGKDGRTAISQAYDVQRMTDLQALETSLANFYSTSFSYPDSLEDLVPDYVSSIPQDPETFDEYGYEQLGSGYRLYCILSDKDKMKNDEGNDPNYYELISE